MPAACRTRLWARRIARGLIVVAVPLLSASIADEPAHPEAAVKAAFLFRFAGYVDWPEESATRATFEFAIVGSDEIAAELRRRLPGHAVGRRPTLVHEHARARDVASADVIYLAPGHADGLPDLPSRVRGALVVTDEERGLARGATLNFVREGDRVRFEASLRAAERAGLRLRAGLLSVAVRVEGREEPPPP